MNLLLDAWRSLEMEGRSDNGWKALRIFPGATFPIRAAIEEPTGRRAVLFDFHAVSLLPVREYPSAHGFEFFPEVKKPGPSGTVRLCLVFSQGFDESLTSRLGNDVTEAAASASSEKEGVKALLARLEAWQVFLRKHSEGLTHEEQIGLYGELCFLRLLLANGVSPMEAITSWRGPEGGLRDFILSECEVEIKTSVGGGFLFHVGSLDQLDEIQISRLVLCHQSLRISADGETLPEAVQQIDRIFVDSHPQSEFHRLLILAGYSDYHSKIYDLRRYQTSGTEFFDVRDGFPRIRPSDVRHGITGAAYQVDIQVCGEYLLTSDDVLSLLVPGGWP